MTKYANIGGMALRDHPHFAKALASTVTTLIFVIALVAVVALIHGQPAPHVVYRLVPVTGS